MDDDDTSLAHAIGYAIGWTIRAALTLVAWIIHATFIAIAITTTLAWLFLLIIIQPALQENRAR